MTELERELAKNCYGYGRWEADYWFIGPEQGQDKTETDINVRFEAFRKLEKDGLCDCQKFHESLPGNKFFVGDARGNIKPQATWNYMIVLLLEFLNYRSTLQKRKEYQSVRWGSADSEIGATCVAELRGLPAHSSRESIEQDKFLKERIANFCKRLEAHPPKFVVFYGIREAHNWSKIAGVPVVLDGFVAHGKTLFAYLPHPNARKEDKRSHADWQAMGKKLREHQANIEGT